MSHYLSLLLFLPLVGALLVLFVPKQNENAIRWIANVVTLVGFVVSMPLWFWYNPQNPDFQFVERMPWIPSVGAEYFLGVDGFSTLLILLTTLIGVDRDAVVVDRDHRAGEGVLHLPAGAADRHARRVHVARLPAVLPVLGSDAGADVLPHRHLGQRQPALLGDQVLPLHPGRQRRDAARDPGALLLQPHRDRRVHVRRHPVPEAEHPVRPAVVGLPGVLPRLRHQGADVPVPHLAARRAHRRADGRLGDPGGRAPEDGHLRLHPLQPADSAGGDPLLRAVRRLPLHRRHRLRRAGGARAEGLEAARRLFVGQPHGDGDARDVRAQSGRHHRQHHPAAQSRHFDRRRSSCWSASSTSAATRARFRSTAACRR